MRRDRGLVVAGHVPVSVPGSGEQRTGLPGADPHGRLDGRGRVLCRQGLWHTPPRAERPAGLEQQAGDAEPGHGEHDADTCRPEVGSLGVIFKASRYAPTPVTIAPGQTTQGEGCRLGSPIGFQAPIASAAPASVIPSATSLFIGGGA